MLDRSSDGLSVSLCVQVSSGSIGTRYAIISARSLSTCCHLNIKHHSAWRNQAELSLVPLKSMPCTINWLDVGFHQLGSTNVLFPQCGAHGLADVNRSARRQIQLVSESTGEARSTGSPPHSTVLTGSPLHSTVLTGSPPHSTVLTSSPPQRTVLTHSTVVDCTVDDYEAATTSQCCVLAHRCRYMYKTRLTVLEVFGCCFQLI